MQWQALVIVWKQFWRYHFKVTQWIIYEIMYVCTYVYKYSVYFQLTIYKPANDKNKNAHIRIVNNIIKLMVTGIALVMKVI